MLNFSSISNLYTDQKSLSSSYVQKKQSPFFKPFIQPKLTINQPNDIYEQEADIMADKVMRMRDNDAAEQTFFKPSLFSIHRKCAHCDEEEKAQRKESDNSAIPNISPAVEQTLQSTGQPMDVNTRSSMERRFDYNFSNVQIHNDTLAHQSSADINALAYTHGSHVVFGAGKYQPGTGGGKQLLAHELTHVIQQSKDVAPGRGIIHRKCSGTATGNAIVSGELPDYEMAVKNNRYCKDTGFSGSLHEGAVCFREVPLRIGDLWPSGDQVCIDPKTGDCEESRDVVSPVEYRNADGSCNLHWFASLGHFASDIITSERVLTLAGFGLFAGTALGYASAFGKSRAFGATGGFILGTALAAAIGAGLGPATRWMARRGYVPTVGVSARSGIPFPNLLDTSFESRLYLGAESRDAVLSIFYPSLKIGIGLVGEDINGDSDSAPTGATALTSLLAGFKVDLGAPGGGYVALHGGPSIAINRLGSSLGAEASVSFGRRWRWIDFSTDVGYSYNPAAGAGQDKQLTLGVSLTFGADKRIED